MSLTVEVQVEKLLALFRQYDAAKPKPIPLMTADGRMESAQEKAKRTKDGRTHPWRAPGQAPLSEPRQEVRERDAVPSHANPISKAGRGWK